MSLFRDDQCVSACDVFEIVLVRTRVVNDGTCVIGQYILASQYVRVSFVCYNRSYGCYESSECFSSTLLIAFNIYI